MSKSFDKDLWLNPYRALSSEGKLKYKERNNADILTLGLIGMFEYEKSEIYKNIDDATIEYPLIVAGTNGFWKDGDEIVCGFSWPGGALDENGVGTLINGNLFNGRGFEGINGISAVCGWNNATRTPDREIAKYASYLSECETSEEAAIRYTRNTPVYTVKNGKIKQLLENALKKVFKGDPITITDDSLSLTNNPSVEVVNLTDPAGVDKLQYLNTYHNDLMRRFYGMYGQALNESMKLAQQSVAEVSSNMSNSFILPLDRLKQRQKMCKELERVFGGSISVRFTEPWRIEYEKWSNINNQNAVDGNFENDKEGMDDGNSEADL